MNHDAATPAGPIFFATPDIDEADIAAVASVMRSGWITTGDQVVQLEQELAAYLDIEHVVAVSSCTAALEISAAYLGLPKGARVGVPTWTFVSSALAFVHHGLTPVLLDIDPDTFNVSPASLERALQEGLDVVVPVHFGGIAVDTQVRHLCQAADVPIVEDAAHALGAVDERGRVAGRGSLGACFSFYATKNLTSAEGGAISTDNAEFADFARSYRLHGMSRDAWTRYRPGATASYDLEFPGIKANLPDLLAALALSQFGRFEAMQAKRRMLTTRYRENLADIDVRFVPGEPNVNSADHLCMVVLPEHIDREHVVAELRSHGISTSVHFRPLHRFSWFAKHASIGPSGVPVAERVAGSALSLPLSSGLSVEAVDRVCEALEVALRR